MCDALHQDYRIIERNDYCFSIVNAFPLKDGHLMVLPRRHVIEMAELSEIESKSMFEMMNVVYLKLEKRYLEGVVLFKNGRGHLSQEHLHFHLLPSKVGLRKLVSSYEAVPFKERASEERLREIRNYVNGF